MFSPPPAFEAPGDEADFLTDYAARFVTHGRSAIVLALITWIAYSGWDFFYGFRNEEFRQTLSTMSTQLAAHEDRHKYDSWGS